MLKAIVEFSLRFRGVVLALGLLAIAYGLYETYHAKLDVFPEFAPPQVVMQTEGPGLSAEQVEQLVTQRIEIAVNGAAGLESIRSTSIQGLSVITLVFSDATDIYKARQIVGERLLEVASQMPQGVAAPTMTPLTSATSMILSIGLTSKTLAPIDLRTFADWTIRPRLLSVPGVAKVSVFGGGIRELQIQVDPARLVAYGISITDVLTAARAATGVRGAGFVENNNQRIVLQTEGQALTPEALGNGVLAHYQGASVRLRDVARVQWAPAPQIGDALVMGKPGIVLLVSSQYGANTLQVTAGVDRALNELRPTLEAENVTLHPDLFRAATFIETAVHDVRSSLLVGGVLVAVVLSVFLYNVRTAFISLTAIPLSLLIAIIVLQRLGMALNTLTLGGLAIAIGEVVDDAIIDVENVFRRLKENRALGNPRRIFPVILDASLEVRSAVVYATFIVALVFLPVLTMSGVQGRIFAPLGFAYIFATLASLGVALTITPALCFFLLPNAQAAHETALVSRVKAKHLNLLERISAHTVLVIGGAVALCVLAIAALPFFGGSFLPKFQERSFVVHMVGIPGTSLAESARMGGEVTKALLKNPFVARVSQHIGRAELGDDTGGPHYSEFDVRLKELDSKSVGEIQDELRATLEGLTGFGFSLNSFLTERIDETLSGTTADVAIKIFGDDLGALDRQARKVADLLSRIKGAADVRIESPAGMPEMIMQLLPSRLLQFGYRPVDVLDAIQTTYQGSAVAQLYEGNRFFDVSVILDPDHRRVPESVNDLMIRNADGALMPLDELAAVHLAPGPYSILHDSAHRVQLVTCNVEGRDLTGFVDQAERGVRSQIKPGAGIYIEFAGAAQARAQSAREILFNSLIAAVIIGCLLYIAFGNVTNMLLVLANVPFALVGGVIAAWITGGQLSLGSLVGFVTLFGITMRNSIMMISHFDHLVTVEGMTWGHAAAMRGASERLLPILMTALVTALGLLPLALGSGAPGREIEGPMAIIILGGLFTSTALNLLVLPSLAMRYGRFETPQAEGVGDAETL